MIKLIENKVRFEYLFYLYMWREIDLIFIIILDFYVKECEVDNIVDICEFCFVGFFMFDCMDFYFLF